jgi:hypothetical protein
LAALAGLAACGGDDPSRPGTVEVVDHLTIEAPGTITPDQPFELRIIAVGSEGTQPFPDFDGKVELLISEGSITPSSVTLSAGEGAVTATVQTTASSVELTAGHASASGSLDVSCAKDAAVIITSGRFYLSSVAAATTPSQDQLVRDEEEASMPQSLDFSEALSAEAQATHLTVEEELFTAFGASESDLVVTSRALGSSSIVGMSIVGGGSGVATWDGGTSSGGGTTGLTGFVEFSFTVENDTILATCDGTFDKAGFSLSTASGTRLLDTFDLGTVQLAPGEYEFRANLFNGTVSATGVKSLTDFSSSIDMTLAFLEVAPEE